MLRNIALKSLRDIRRGFLWWSLGLIGFVALIVSVYPTVHSNPSLNKLAQDYPEALQAFIAFGGAVDYASAAGYLGIELFSLMVPLLLLVAAIGTGRGDDRRRGGARHARAAAREPGLAHEGRAREDGRARARDRRPGRSCSGSRSGSARCLDGHGHLGGPPRRGHAQRGPARARLRRDRGPAGRGDREGARLRSA